MKPSLLEPFRNRKPIVWRMSLTFAVIVLIFLPVAFVCDKLIALLRWLTRLTLVLIVWLMEWGHEKERPHAIEG